MKKMFKYVISFLMIMGILCISARAKIVNAESTKDTKMDLEKKEKRSDEFFEFNVFYKNTNCEIPKEIIKRIKTELGDMLESLYTGKTDQLRIPNFSIMNPFVIKKNNEFLFPVLKNGIICGTLTAYEDDGEYYLQFEKDYLAIELEKLQKIGKLKEFRLVITDKQYYALEGNRVVSLMPGGDLNATIDEIVKSVKKEKGEIISAPSKEILFDASLKRTDNFVKNNLLKSPAPPEKKYLDIKPVAQTENGDWKGKSMNWCSAAVTASFINFKKGTHLKARDVAYKAHGNYSNTSVSTGEVKNIAKEYNISLIKSAPMGIDSVKYQISSNRPIYMCLVDDDIHSNHGKHAIGLTGYNKTKYRIINPWFNNQDVYIDNNSK